MSELIKISVSNCKTNAAFIAMKSKKVFENVSFGDFDFQDDCWDGCKFVNCKFDKMTPHYSTYVYVRRQNIVFENCTFCDQGAFTKGEVTFCKFIGCTFDNGWIYTFFYTCEFTDCKFDHSHLYGNRFNACSFKRCKSEFCDIGGVKCFQCVGKAFIRLLSPMACPEKGEYEAWKRCFCLGNGKRVYAKLLIPADARRSSAHGSKCRASKAKVLGFYNANGRRIPLKKARSWWDETFIYKVGETAKPTRPFDKNRYDECTSGIHHFMTLAEAVEWN